MMEDEIFLDNEIDLSNQVAPTFRSSDELSHLSSKDALNIDDPNTMVVDCNELELLGSYSDFDSLLKPCSSESAAERSSYTPPTTSATMEDPTTSFSWKSLTSTALSPQALGIHLMTCEPISEKLPSSPRSSIERGKQAPKKLMTSTNSSLLRELADGMHHASSEISHKRTLSSAS